jgi:chromate transport protein ChrA
VLAAFCYSIKISAIAISILALFAIFQKNVVKQNKQLIILAISIIGISLIKNVFR